MMRFQPPQEWRSVEVFVANLLARELRPQDDEFASFESLCWYAVAINRLRAAGVVDPETEERLAQWLDTWGLTRRRYDAIMAIVDPARC